MMRAIGIATLGLGLFAVTSTLGVTPAFNQTLRQGTAYGDWRIGHAPSMYDPGAYYFQLGHSYLLADAVFSAETEGQGEVASFEVADERAARAVELLTQSVNLDPGNAHAWTSLGWAHAMRDDIDAARFAMGRSWELAQYNLQLAERRLSFVAVLTTDFDQSGETIPLTETEAAFAADDVALLRLRDKRTLDALIPDLPVALTKE